MVAVLHTTSEPAAPGPRPGWPSSRPAPLRLVRGGLAPVPVAATRARTGRRPAPAVAADPRRRHRPEVYRRRRQLAAALVLVLGFGAWLAGRALFTRAASPLAGSAGIATHLYYVQPGDTLWSIAARVQPSGDERALVDQLSAEVHGRPLQVGQAVRVP